MSKPLDPISTPPSTTLSTPSPTELYDTDPLATSTATATMSPTRALKHIYLIVATTPVTTSSGLRLGIGLNGRLPWPMIKADMNYFRRVTTDGRETSSSSTDDSARHVNSVIMGRKTYESIPPSYRPLSGRRNYLVTRGNAVDLAERFRGDLVAQSEKARQTVQERYAGGSQTGSDASNLTRTSPEYRELQLSEAEFTTVKQGDEAARVTSSNDAIEPVTVTSSLQRAIHDSERNDHSEIFCIGGAEIYDLLLRDSTLRPRLRILQTEIQKVEGGEFECDTFWPEELRGGVGGWVEVEEGEVVRWMGVELPQGGEGWLGNRSVGVRIRVRGWRQGE